MRIEQKTRSKTLILQYVLRTVLIFVGTLALRTGYGEDRADREISIPDGIALIRDHFSGESGHTVIHIQDAHANEEAQMNLAKLIKLLSSRGKDAVVLVEGEQGPVDLSLFRQFPMPAVREWITMQYLREGRLHGEEFAAINFDKRISIYGVEDPSLYQANKLAYQTAKKMSAAAETAIQDAVRDAWKILEKIIPARLMDLEKAKRDFDAGVLSLEAYAERLRQTALSEGLRQEGWKTLQMLFKGFEMNRSMDQAQLRRSMENLMRSLSETLSKDDLSRLVFDTLQYRSGKRSEREFLEELLKAARQSGTHGADLEAIRSYYEYVVIRDDLSKEDRLYPEMDEVLNALRTHLGQSPDQKALYRVLDQLQLMAKLARLEMTPDEMSRIAGGALADFQGISETLRSLGRRHNIETGSGGMPFSDTLITNAQDHAMKFYALSKERDRILARETLRVMRRNKNKTILLVAGGFHTPGITRTLRDSGVSYWVLAPRVSRLDSGLNYEDLMMDRPRGLESLLLSAHLRPQGLLSRSGAAQALVLDLAAAMAAVEPQRDAQTLNAWLDEAKKQWPELVRVARLDVRVDARSHAAVFFYDPAGDPLFALQAARPDGTILSIHQIRRLGLGRDPQAGQAVFTLVQGEALDELRQSTQTVDESAVSETETIVLSGRSSIPGFKDIPGAALYLDRYEKLFPLMVHFLAYFGGKGEYASVADALKTSKLAIGPTRSGKVDIDAAARRITIEKEYLDFLLLTGRKKITAAVLAGAALQLLEGPDADIRPLQTAITRPSLILTGQSRVDDTNRLYDLKKTVERNDTLMSPPQPYFLTAEDRRLAILDLLHRGRIMDRRRAQEHLHKEYGYYGMAGFDELQRDFDAIVALAPDIYEIREVMEEGLNGRQEKNILYGFKRAYQQDPHFKGRLTVWDIEVERQDEVDFGGKSAHTGEMMFSPHTVTLPNFFTGSIAFQHLMDHNARDVFTDQVNRLILKLEALKAEQADLLNRPAADLPESVRKEVQALRVVLEDEGANVLDQINRQTEMLKAVLQEMQDKNVASLREYFKILGPQMENLIAGLKDQREHGEITEADYRIQYEKKIAEYAGKMVAAVRSAAMPPDLDSEIKEKLRLLAQRLGIDVKDLVLAVRSSAVGEDSEEASFAGRQDTYIFVTPSPAAGDPEGLDGIIHSWIFNQASLFNKRAMEYRLDEGLPAYEDSVEISTLFQQMFLSELSWIGFTVDRKSGFPAVSMSVTEGQGEMLVSGRETGSEFLLSPDGVILARAKGDRKHAIVETPDGKGKVLVDIPDEQKREFALTSERILKQAAAYMDGLGRFYGIFADLEGAFRRKRDREGNILWLRDKDSGEILKDETGKPIPDWMIASTQARPETKYNLEDSNIIRLRKRTLTDRAYARAEAQGKVLPFNFVAKTGGVAKGRVVKVLNKEPETLARVTRGTIMVTEQSDPDMNSAMVATGQKHTVKEGEKAVDVQGGIVAVRGGQNSHTMIVASEYGLIAVTGSTEALLNALQDGEAITIDGERGKILLGVDHQTQIEGNDFDVRKLPKIEGIKLGTITASAENFKRAAPLRNWPGFYGTGLMRLELLLAEIGVYPDALQAYDNLLDREAGEPYEGPVLDRREDRGLIEAIESKLDETGFHSGRSLYIHTLSEGIQLAADTHLAPKETVVAAAQQIRDGALRAKTREIVEHAYRTGLGDKRHLSELKAVKDRAGRDDAAKISTVYDLMNKPLYIRLDDRKSDEYAAVIGADKFIREERNPMLGLRGLELMLQNPVVLRWQLEAIKRVVDTGRNKISVFAPVVRRPADLKRLLDIMEEMGFADDNIEVGLMTEIPRNVFDIDEFLALRSAGDTLGVAFTSTGGNDLLQMTARIDRQTPKEMLKAAVTAYSPSILRSNRIITLGRERNSVLRAFLGREPQKSGYCGNDPSVKGQEDYARILKELGYDSVSVVLAALPGVADNLVNPDLVLKPEVYDAKSFSFEADPFARPKTVEYSQFNVADLHLKDFPFHYRALSRYDAARQELDPGLTKSVREALQSAGIDPDDPAAGKKYYVQKLSERIRSGAETARQSGQMFVLGTADEPTDALRRLPGGDQFEIREANPDLGYLGMVKNVDMLGDLQFFQWALEALARVKSEGYDNLGITLRVVRGAREIDIALPYLERAGLLSLQAAPSDIRVGLDVLSPSNILELDQLLDPARGRRINFVSVPDRRKLAALIMASELGNENIGRMAGRDLVTDQDVDEVLRMPVRIIATAAEKYGVDFHIEGGYPAPVETVILGGTAPDPAGRLIVLGADLKDPGHIANRLLNHRIEAWRLDAQRRGISLKDLRKVKVIDASSLLGVNEKGEPQLKALGFSEGIKALKQRIAVNEGIDIKNIEIIIVNTEPLLDAGKIMTALSIAQNDELVRVEDVAGEAVKPGFPGVSQILLESLNRGDVRRVRPEDMTVAYLDTEGKRSLIGKVEGVKYITIKPGADPGETVSALGVILAAILEDPGFLNGLPDDMQEEVKKIVEQEGIEGVLNVRPVRIDINYLDELRRANEAIAKAA